MTTIDFVQADAVAWARDYTGEKFHALICDPPYHQKTTKNGKGILNTTWDSGDVAFQVATWKAFYNVLLCVCRCVCIGAWLSSLNGCY